MKPQVLAVDDEPAILELLRHSLEFEGYSVLTTTTAAEFRIMYAENDVAIFIVDVALPDGNGFALVKELRQTTTGGIILLTGRDSETDQVVGLEIGADDYVTKPFRMRELAARVNAVYRRTSMNQAVSAFSAPDVVPSAQTIDFEFDNYQLSIAARRLWHKDNGEVVLTTAEFDLLHALLRRRGQVLDRDQLLNAIKGREWESYDRAIDGLISRLRRKLPAEGRVTHYIRTVHGIGYSFGA